MPGLFNHPWNFVLGSLIIAFYSVKRFGTPDTYQGSTTRSRYRRSCFSYLLAAEILFLVLSWAVSSTDALAVLAPAAAKSNQIPKEVLNLSAPLLAALLMTTFTSSVPLLSDVDQWLLGKFREFANIPDELKRRAAELQPTKLRAKISIAELRAFVEGTDEIPNELLDEIATGGEGWVTKHLIHNIFVYRWLDRAYQGGTPRYSRFLQRHEAEWKDVRDRFSIFCAHSLVMLVAARSLSGQGPGNGSRGELAALRKSHADHSKAMFTVMAALLARSVLACEPNDKAISRTLEEIGFPASAKTDQPHLPMDELTLVSIGLLFILVLGPATLPHLGLMTWPPIEGVPAASIPVLALTAHVASISVAVWWKYKFALPGMIEGGRRSALDYANAFALAWLAAVGVAIVIFVLTHSWSNPAALLGFPYAHFSLWAAIVATAVVAACDNRWPKRALGWHPWLNSLCCGLIVAVSVPTVDWTITSLVGDWAAMPLGPPAARWMIAGPMIFGFLAGAIPGLCIPARYRASLPDWAKSREREPERQPFLETIARWGQAVLRPRRPQPGEPAAGYGVSGTIADVPDQQPLAEYGIFRVFLAGEKEEGLVELDLQWPDVAWLLVGVPGPDPRTNRNAESIPCGRAEIATEPHNATYNRSTTSLKGRVM